MKLSDCVTSADIQTLQKIAKRYDLPCIVHSKHSLLQEILFTFRSKQFVEVEASKWREAWGAIFVRLCLDNRDVFSVEEIHAMFQVEDNRQRLDLALSEGWLFPVTQIPGRPCYLIPDELLVAMRDALLDYFSGQVSQSMEDPLIYRDEEYAMVRDIDVFLEYVLHHEVQLTSDGAIYKRFQTQILTLIEVEEEPLEGGWRFGYGRRCHDYPDRFALLYDFSFHHGLIEESTSGYLRITEEAMGWRKLSLAQRQRQLLQFYISLYRRPIPRLPQIIQTIAGISPDWVESHSLYLTMSELVPKFYYDEALTVWQTRIIKMLMHLGVIRIGEDEIGQTWFQMTILGQQLVTGDFALRPNEEAKEGKRVLVVQPNFDIMVTANDPLITLEVSKCTELKESGALRLYRMTEQSVLRGLLAGCDMGKWLRFISDHAQNPIPGNVERTLQEWAARAVDETNQHSS
jgi:hypothetical protein